MRWTAGGIRYEADPRHAELLTLLLGPRGKPVSTPAVRPRSGQDRFEEKPEEEARRGARAPRARWADVEDTGLDAWGVHYEGGDGGGGAVNDVGLDSGGGGAGVNVGLDDGGGAARSGTEDAVEQEEL